MAKRGDEWFPLSRAVVAYDHARHAPLGDVIDGCGRRPDTLANWGRRCRAIARHGVISARQNSHRFEGRSWRDELAASGFHCWGLDFHGFGRFSDPYPQMAEPAEKHAPLGRAEDASGRLEQAVRFICAHHRVNRISLIARSWGGRVGRRTMSRAG
jgi:hypothetical protein